MNKMEPVKKSHNGLAWSAIIVCLFIFTLYCIVVYRTTKNDFILEDMDKRINVIEEDIKIMKSDLNVSRLETLEMMQVPEEPKYKEFLFTNYGLWDGESTDTTASLLNTRSFELNDEGIYTYDGYVVLGVGHSAVAPLKEGFVEYQLGDLLAVEFNNKQYTGIVLDRCGVCTWGNDTEELQRIDVFTSADVIGKQVGRVYE